MKVKKILVYSIGLMILISSLGIVSAGLFDFGSGGNGLASYDFDDFTMDIPEGIEFNKTDTINGGDGLVNAIADNGGTMPVDDIYDNPKLVHSIWEDENSTITVELIDLKEDGYDDAEEAVLENFANSTVIDEQDGIMTFDISDVYKDSFAVSKNNEKDLVVIVTGQDRDQITEMISSLQFK